jgi:hypothetical protein
MNTGDRFENLAAICSASGSDAMLDALAASLAARKRWHAVFDARIIQARLAIGLPPVGAPGDVPPHLRDAFDDRSLAACREAGPCATVTLALGAEHLSRPRTDLRVPGIVGSSPMCSACVYWARRSFPSPAAQAL